MSAFFQRFGVIQLALVAGALSAMLGCMAPPEPDDAVTLITPHEHDVIPDFVVFPERLARGDSVRWLVQGAPPNATLRLFYGQGQGDGPCPLALDGECLGIRGPVQELGIGETDVIGEGLIITPIPPDLPLGTSWFQAVADDDGDVELSDPFAEWVFPRPCVDDAIDSETRLEEGVYEALQACDGVEDWYEVRVPSGEGVQLNLGFEALRGDIDVDLWNHDRTDLIARGWTEDDDESVAYLNRSRDDVSVWVRAYLRSETTLRGGNGYSLAVDRFAGSECPVDAFEPNDTRGDVASVGEGVWTGLGACSGDEEDWFQLELGVGDVVTVSADFAHAEGDIDLALFEADAPYRRLTQSIGLEDGEHLTWEAVRAARVHLRVQLHQDSGETFFDGNAYDLTIDID